MLDGSPLTVVGYGSASSSPAFTPALDSTRAPLAGGTAATVLLGVRLQIPSAALIAGS
jgi:hypothetical protein